MRIKTDQQALKRAIRAVTRPANRWRKAAPLAPAGKNSIKRKANPLRAALRHVAISADVTSDEVRLSSTDGSTHAQYTFDAEYITEGSEPGSLALMSFRDLREFVAAAPGEIVVTGVDGRVDLRHEASNSVMSLVAPIDEVENAYPRIPNVSYGGKTIDILATASDFRRAARYTTFAAAKDDGRPVLTGILVESTGGKFLEIAAADGFRLSQFKLPVDRQIRKRFKLVVPAVAIEDFVTMLPADADEVEISINHDRTLMRFAAGPAVVVTQLIQGSYPSYKQLIPTESATTVIVSTQKLMTVVQQAHPIAVAYSNITKYKFVADEDAILVFTKQHADSQGDPENTYRAKVDCLSIDGDGRHVALNIDYLTAFLKTASAGRSGSTIDIRLPSDADRNGAVSFRLPDVPDFLHLLMPMFVEWKDEDWENPDE